MPQTVTEAYRVISEGILEGFKTLGLNAYFAIPRTEEEKEGLKSHVRQFVLMHLHGTSLSSRGGK